MKPRISSHWSGLVALALAGSGASADPGAAKLLKAANEAISQTQSLAYNAELTTHAGTAKEPSARLTAEVMMKRTADEKGVGWKLYIGGEAAQGADLASTSKVYIAFDGFAARSVKEAEKAVFEKNAIDAPSLESFLVMQGGREVVLWQMITSAPIPDAADPKDSGIEPAQEIDGQKCDVVWVRSGDDKTTYYLAASDRLPRKIEIVTTPSTKEGVEKKDRTVRTLALTNVKRNVPINEATFIVDIPDEFVVRAVKNTPAPDSKTDSKSDAKADGKVAGAEESKKPAQKTQPPGMLTPGTPAPAWTLKDGNGKETKLADYRGKVVVLDFWGSWCPPCRAAMPSIEKIHQKYKDKGVVVLGLNYERRPDADPKKFMADNGITYGLVLGAETIADKYKVPGWPTFYVIDRQGDIVWGSVGFSKADAEEHESTMSEAIEEAMQEGL